MSDVNDSMVDDFFSDAGGLVDQDTGSPISNTQDQQQSQQHNPGNQLPNQNPPNATNAKTEAVPNQQLNGSQQPQGNAQQPAKTFDMQFYDVDEKGNQTFNADKALSFMSQNNGFQYEGITSPLSRMPQQPAQQQQTQPIQPEKPAWQIELEEEDRIRTESRSKHTTWRAYLEEAFKNGYTGDNAIAYADQRANEESEKDFKKSWYEFRAKKSEEADRKAKEQAELTQLEPTSKVNLAKVYNELGGEDQFNTLIYGALSPDGKSLSGGFGIEVLNREFDKDHRGQKLPTDPVKLREVYDKWWIKYSSDINNIRFVVDVAKARLQMAMFPQITNHISSIRDAGNRQMSQAKQSSPSSINKSQGTREPDSLDQYLYGGGATSQGSYDTV